jgi:hypothetical protein
MSTIIYEISNSRYGNVSMEDLKGYLAIDTGSSANDDLCSPELYAFKVEN